MSLIFNTSIYPNSIINKSSKPTTLQRANASKDLIKQLEYSTEQKWKALYDIYIQTPAYNIENAKLTEKWSKGNSLYNRFKRFNKEPVVVIEQNIFEKLNYIFTAVLLIFTIVLFFYEKKNNLLLIPSPNDSFYDMCNDFVKLSDSDKQKKIAENNLKIQYYQKVKITSDIIKAISIIYIALLTTNRIYKRTTL
jgi:hypothetical protein